MVLLPVTPSATVADSSDSMAPSTAMVKAEGSSRLMVAMLSSKPRGRGISVLMVPKRSPMVWTAKPSMPLRKYVAAVTVMMAMSAPGSLFDIFGVNIIMSSDTRPTASVGRLMLPNDLK